MNLFKNDFEKNWSVLFEDVKKLNEYSSSHLIEMRDIKVEERDIEGAIFTGSTFKNIEWSNVDAGNIILTNVVFEKCKFIGGRWGQGILTDVVFKDCEFTDTSFSQSTMTNVRFENCNLVRTGVAYLTGGKVIFIECSWDRGAAGDSRCEFLFQKCKLSGISFSMMEMRLPILFEDCFFDEIDFHKSLFSDVILRRVKQGEGGVKFNSVTAKSISFEDVEMLKGVGMGWANVALVRIVGGKLYGPAFKEANIAKTVIRDAYVTRFATGHMGKVEVANSTLHRSGLFEGEIQELSVVNSTIDEIVGKNFKADTVLWDNVTLSGKIDLTNAQVKDFRPTRIQRSPDLQLITTGSNMKF
jgi:uncharacterized protein YjbI with pentapeptide repeats